MASDRAEWYDQTEAYAWPWDSQVCWFDDDENAEEEKKKNFYNRQHDLVR